MNSEKVENEIIHPLSENEGWFLYWQDGENLDGVETGWGLCNYKEDIRLHGFETLFDAFAFLFASASIDTSLVGGRKTVGRWWSFKPKQEIDHVNDLPLFAPIEQRKGYTYYHEWYHAGRC